MNTAIDILLIALMAVGAFFTLLGGVALVKLPTFFQRIHGPTKASTLGVGCFLIASIIYHAIYGVGLHPRELLITIFLFLTAPVSAHMMAKSALSLMKAEAPLPPNTGPAKVRGEAATAGHGTEDSPPARESRKG